MNKKFTVLVGLLVAVVVTSYSVCGTYAKYTEDFEGTSSNAAIAKWDIKAINADDTVATTNDFTFNLLETSTNASLKEGTDTKLLAPGSKGTLKIKLRNDSDVKAEYTVKFDKTGITVPLKFKVNGASDYSELTDITTAVAMNDNETTEIVVDWEWPYEVGDDDVTKATNNAADTTIGKNPSAVSLKATVTVSQVAA